MLAVLVRVVARTLLLLVVLFPATAAADPVRTSTLGWMINGIVSEVVRAGDIAFLGGSFRTVSPIDNQVFHAVTFSTTSAVAVLPRLELNGRLRAVAAIGGGGWIIGGEFTRVNGSTRHRLVRLRADGTLDPTLDLAVDGTVRALAISGTTLYIGGSFTTVGGSAREGVAAINLQTNAVVSGFAPAVSGGAVFDMVVDGTTVYLAGDFTTIGSSARANVAAVNASTGAPVSTFDANADGRAVRLVKSGTHLFVAGDFQNVGGQARRGIAKLDASTGAAITAFNAQMTTSVKGLAVGANAVYVGGAFSQAGGSSRFRLAALDLSSGTATSWNPGAAGDVASLALSGSTLFAAGSFEEIGSHERLYLAALDTTRSTDPVLAWNPALNNSADFLTVDGNGFVFVGGSFTGYGAVRRDNLAAIDLHRGDLSSWNPGANGWVRALDVDGNTVYIGGDFTTIGGVSRSRIAAIDALTGEASAWNPAPNAPVKGLMVADNAVYFVGQFSSLHRSSGSITRGHGAAVDFDGTVRSWNPAANETIESLFVDGTRVYLGGNFTALGTQTRNRVAAVSATDGAALANFSPSVNGVVYRVDVLAGVLYFGGSFDLVNGSSRSNAAAVQAFSANTSPAAGTLLTWAPHVSGPVYDLDGFGSVVYLAGGFGAVDGASRPGIAMVSADSSNAVLQAWRPTDVLGGQVSVIDTSEDAVLFGGSLRDANNIDIGAVLYPDATIAAAPRPPTTPELRVSGSTIAMSWSRPPLGPQPAAYVIEGGSASGRSDLANFSTGSSSTSFSASGLPAGTYYFRMRAANQFGSSIASEEQAFSIGGAGCSAPPQSPLDVIAIVTGSTIALQWRASPQSIVNSYVVRAGSVSGSSELGALNVGAATSTTVNAPAGAFFLTVVAMNNCGTSAPSQETVAVVGGATVPPGRPFSLEGTVSSRTVTLSWGPPSVGSGPFQYLIEAGSAPGASDIAVVPATATSVMASAIPPGVYYLRVRAIGVAGAGPTSNEIVLVVQ